MLALAASAAYSKELRDLEDTDDIEDNIPHERLLNSLGAGWCMHRATGPEDWCWLKSNLYQSYTRDRKRNEIWNFIVGNSLEPQEPMWEDFDEFFT